MKRIMMLLAVGVLSSAAIYANEPIDKGQLTQARIQCIEKSLIKAFQSDIPRLQITAALTLRRLRILAPEYNWDLCVNPLMHVLNGEEHDPAARVVAAMTLHELRSSRGDFAIVCNARFGDSYRVKHYCAILANTRISEENKR